MPNKKPKDRIYWRHQGGTLRAYIDLRDYADVLPVGPNGKKQLQQALKVPGERHAVTDPDLARKLESDLVQQLNRRRELKTSIGTTELVRLRDYAAHHLQQKALRGKVSEGWLELTEKRLTLAVRYFEALGLPYLLSVGPVEMQGYANYLATLPSERGGMISGGYQRHYLNALGNLFKRAIAEGKYKSAEGHAIPNPVWALLEKPGAAKKEAAFLEAWEGALLLEAARVYPYDGDPGDRAELRLARAIEERMGAGPVALEVFAVRMRAQGLRASLGQVEAYARGERVPTRRFLLTAADVLGVPREGLYREHNATGRNRPSRVIYPLLATLLLTGGRSQEVRGLALRDINLFRQTVTFRENAWRRVGQGIKTENAIRVVRLWPQLREILTPWIEERRRQGAKDSDLVFPSARTGRMITDIRKALDTIGQTAGWEPGALRAHDFRHTYCAARLQTLDRGLPVSNRLVADELGHGGEDLVKEVYGHLGLVPHRAEVVEYRIEQQAEHIPAERLGMLQRVA